MMKNNIQHEWDLSPDEARTLQVRLAGRVVREFSPKPVRTIAGVDGAFNEDTGCAAIVVLAFPELEPVESAVVHGPVTFPYLPGLFSFREGPLILSAIEKLYQKPDLIIFDGQGIAHPRRLGIASHIGVLAGLPTIGCAKSRLCGEHADLDEERGSHVPLIHENEIIGAVVRTQTGVKPVYVSIGHRMDLENAVKYVVQSCGKYRLPEPIRAAHQAAG